MCIRDRNKLADDDVLLQTDEPVFLAGDGRPGQHLNGVLEPVSYTHLRAHETVLDLVCRLLLEKKKT